MAEVYLKIFFCQKNVFKYNIKRLFFIKIKMKKQIFDRIYLEKFKKYLNIKEERSEIEKKLLEKTVKYIKYIKWIPWIKMIWVWNSISMNCADSESDIDLFIVTWKNRLWFVRIMITTVFQILKVRKNKKYHASRFCLSFFSTIDWVDFSSFAIKDDIYLYFWIVYFKPILDFDNTYNLFLEKNSNWADFSTYNEIIEKNKNFIKYTWNSTLNNLKILDFIEKVLKKVFLKKTLRTYEKIGKPFWVIINDNLLKFHNGDIREKVKEEITFI